MLALTTLDFHNSLASHEACYHLLQHFGPNIMFPSFLHQKNKIYILKKKVQLDSSLNANFLSLNKKMFQKQ